MARQRSAARIERELQNGPFIEIRDAQRREGACAGRAKGGTLWNRTLSRNCHVVAQDVQHSKAHCVCVCRARDYLAHPEGVRRRIDGLDLANSNPPNSIASPARGQVA